MIQTKTFVSHAKGLNFDMEPNVIIKPRGIAISNVIANRRQFSPNPTSSSFVIVANDELAIKIPQLFLYDHYLLIFHIRNGNAHVSFSFIVDGHT
ncbi:MAG: hypothetical protein UIG59_06600, partial [Acutalibacteraceae bacterium]|nr:hypothetical protein [Acutalibacteraceae bacterium]